MLHLQILWHTAHLIVFVSTLGFLELSYLLWLLPYLDLFLRHIFPLFDREYPYLTFLLHTFLLFYFLCLKYLFVLFQQLLDQNFLVYLLEYLTVYLLEMNELSYLNIHFYNFRYHLYIHFFRNLNVLLILHLTILEVCL